MDRSWKPDRRKVGNEKQLLFAERYTYTDGKAAGLRCVAVTVGELEAVFCEDRALDILRLRYGGKNLSFLAPAGCGSRESDFPLRFDGGFLYTCGIDNVSSCVPGAPVHGSLHLQAAEDISLEVGEDSIRLSGVIHRGALFGEDLRLRRCYTLYADRLSICDTLENRGYTSASYVLLYHMNFGYPFLDEGLLIDLPAAQSEGLTPYARERHALRYTVTPPVDGGDEEVYYHTMRDDGSHRALCRLENKELGLSCRISYDTSVFPVTLQWKSMVSGNYALGIEPSTTRFDIYTPQSIAPGEAKRFEIDLQLSHRVD